MTDAEPKKRSLWREAIACFWRHRKAWLREAAVFMVIFFALDVFSFRDTFRAPVAQPEMPIVSGPQLTPEQLANIKANNPEVGAMLEKQMKGSTAAQEAGQKVPRPGPAAEILQLIAGAVMAYFFSLFFLNDELRRGLSRSWSGFFGFLWRIILSALLMAVCIIIPVATVFIVGRFVLPQNVVLVLTILLACGITIYMSAKLSLVAIMAADGVKTPIRESWSLTEHNVWRIIGNLLMLGLVLVPVMLISTIALTTIPEAGTLGKLLSMAVHAALSVVYAGVFAAFSCMLYGALYKETRKPSGLSPASVS